MKPANEFAPEWPLATKSACADSDRDGVGARLVSPGSSQTVRHRS